MLGTQQQSLYLQQVLYQLLVGSDAEAILNEDFLHFSRQPRSFLASEASLCQKCKKYATLRMCRR